MSTDPMRFGVPSVGDIVQTKVPFTNTWEYATIYGNSVIAINLEKNKEKLTNYINQHWDFYKKLVSYHPFYKLIFYLYYQLMKVLFSHHNKNLSYPLRNGEVINLR